MVRFYTGRGDDGTTDLLGARVAKDDPRIDALGSLDEATSALPDSDQDALYRLAKAKLEQTTLVSVGHRESLAAHHDRRLMWQGRQLALG